MSENAERAVPSEAMLDEIRREHQTWVDLADIERSPLGGNVVKEALYRGTATGLKMAEQIIMEHSSNARGDSLPPRKETNG